MTTTEISLGDYIDVVSGPAFKSASFTDDNTDVPLIKGENIGQGQILWEKSRYWPIHEAQDYSKYRLEPGDIVLAMDRPWVPAGLKWAAINEGDPSSLLVQRVARLRALKGLRQAFLRYVIASRPFEDYIKNLMYGVNVPHISGNQIRSYRLRLPSEVQQDRIADILSAYDDLIENNRRRIALLEQAARELYREWFVRLRFPGHEHVKIVDGVPEGWQRQIFENVCETIGGGTPSTSSPEYWDDGDVEWVTPTDVTRNKCLALLTTEKRITVSGLKNSSAKIVPPNTILMTSRASVGFFALMEREVCTNQGFINIVPHDVQYRMYLLWNLLSRVEEIRSHAGGATYQEISKGKFRQLKIVLPPKALSAEFDNLAWSFFTQTRTLNKQILELSRARDLLLPRLMNGSIAV